MGRKKARDNAFKCIYQLSFDYNLNLDDIFKHCYEENENTDDEKEYIEELVKGVVSNLDDIDNTILKYLKGWSIDRIAKIDLAILRIAIYEIKYITDLSNKVSANEAVELAKEYGLETSSNFVNGVIAKVIEEKV
jgi:transcription antitermination protein NusB